MGAVERKPTALITGVSRGLGQELARQYAADGWKVIGTERRELETTNYGQIREFAKKLRDEPIDLLFCNAGISGKRGMAPGSFDFNLVKGLAATLGSRGITVVALSPGWVRTDMGGEGAPLSPEASVRGLRKVIAGLQPADSGKFLSHDGSTIPW